MNASQATPHTLALHNYAYVLSHTSCTHIAANHSITPPHTPPQEALEKFKGQLADEEVVLDDKPSKKKKKKREAADSDEGECAFSCCWDVFVMHCTGLSGSTHMRLRWLLCVCAC